MPFASRFVTWFAVRQTYKLTLRIALHARLHVRFIRMHKALNIKNVGK